MNITACMPGLEEQVLRYEQAHNAHEVEKVMSLYTDNIRFEIVGTWIKSGKEEVRNLAEWDAVTHSYMIISDIRVDADTVHFRLSEGNDWFRLAGIEFMHYEPCSMVFSDGKIQEIKAAVSGESLKAFGEIWPSIIQWISKERSEKLLELMPGGTFIYDAESAQKWLSLLREWQEETRNR